MGQRLAKARRRNLAVGCFHRGSAPSGVKEPLRLQVSQGLADRCAAHAELSRELALGR